MTSSSTLLQRRPISFWFVLLTWFAITLRTNALFWLDLVHDFTDLQVSCAGVPGVFNGCNFAALTPPEFAVWTFWGLSLPAYAAVKVSGAAFTFLVYMALAGLLLWQQGRSWLGITISLALIVIPYTMNAASRDFAALSPDLVWPNAVANALGNAIVLLFHYLIPNGRFPPRWAYIPMILTLLYPLGGLGLVSGALFPPDPIVSFLNVAVVPAGTDFRLAKARERSETAAAQQLIRALSPLPDRVGYPQRASLLRAGRPPTISGTILHKRE